MKTLFKSQDLWDLVENGFVDTDEPNQQLRDTCKKDSKALFMIQQAVDDEIFPQIAAATTSKEAWEILKKEYLGDEKVISIKLQTLRRDFENLSMGEKESVEEYLCRVSAIVGQRKTYGDDVDNETVVSKVLRSLISKFNHVVSAIEESKDLTTYDFDILKSSLIAHEERINRTSEKVDEKAFQVKGVSNKEKYDNSGGRDRGRDRGRGGFRGRGCGGDNH
ncbi:uncharacterized protein LOC109844775 [Asparagus officinalis]|uniref:uncharacterized protein LOC109844775 n=1 Tax=Asparagus officinalis TaxID=4686 RepID=UPI00098E75BD|nr:uncharacterized protein LOC109844775 [Asparagus officinalis]